MFRTKTRYGAQGVHQSAADIPAIVESLITELETEQFDEPDDEHTQIAVSANDWSLTVQVSGLMTLGKLGWITGSPDDKPIPPLYRRAQSRAEAVRMLTLMAEGKVDEVRATAWTPFSEVAAYERDLFRSRPA